MPEVYAQLPLTVQTKRCTRCQQDKPLDAFAKHARIKSGRRSYCRACDSEIARKYRADNLEAVRASDKARHERDKGKRLAARREYRNRPEVKEHKKIYERSLLERNRERQYANHSRWIQKHPESAVARKHRRRSHKRNNGGTFTGKQWVALKALYGGYCLRCGIRESLSADHVIPLAAGGSNDITNIQPLCLNCNRRKRTQTIDYRRGSFAALILRRRREQCSDEPCTESAPHLLRP